MTDGEGVDRRHPVTDFQIIKTRPDGLDHTRHFASKSGGERGLLNIPISKKPQVGPIEADRLDLQPDFAVTRLFAKSVRESQHFRTASFIKFPVLGGRGHHFGQSLFEKGFGRLDNLIDQLMLPHSISEITRF